MRRRGLRNSRWNQFSPMVVKESARGQKDKRACVSSCGKEKEDVRVRPDKGEEGKLQ